MADAPPPPPPPPRPPAPPPPPPPEPATVPEATEARSTERSSSGVIDVGWFAAIDRDDHLIVARPVRWGMGDSLVGLVLAQASVVLGIVIMTALGIIDDTDGTMTMGVFAVAQAFLWVGYLGWPLLVAGTRGNGVGHDYGWRFSWHDTYQGAVAGLGAQIVGLPAIYLVLFLVIGERDVSEEARRVIDIPSDPVGVTLLVVMLVVGAPIIEELFFRGLVLRSLQRRFGVKVAIAVSAAVFAAIHFQLLQFPALFGFGLILGWITVRSGRLGPAIWAHAAFNGYTVARLLLFE